MYISLEASVITNHLAIYTYGTIYFTLELAKQTNQLINVITIAAIATLIEEITNDLAITEFLK